MLGEFLNCSTTPIHQRSPLSVVHYWDSHFQLVSERVFSNLDSRFFFPWHGLRIVWCGSTGMFAASFHYSCSCICRIDFRNMQTHEMKLLNCSLCNIYIQYLVIGVYQWLMQVIQFGLLSTKFQTIFYLSSGSCSI